MASCCILKHYITWRIGQKILVINLLPSNLKSSRSAIHRNTPLEHFASNVITREHVQYFLSVCLAYQLALRVVYMNFDIKTSVGIALVLAVDPGEPMAVCDSIKHMVDRTSGNSQCRVCSVPQNSSRNHLIAAFLS